MSRALCEAQQGMTTVDERVDVLQCAGRAVDISNKGRLCGAQSAKETKGLHALSRAGRWVAVLW